MDQLEQENRELCEEGTTLREKVEKLTSLVFSLAVTQDSSQFHQRPQQQYLTHQHVAVVNVVQNLGHQPQFQQYQQQPRQHAPRQLAP